MFEHTSNGTLFAAVATGALILWLDSRTDRRGKSGGGRQFSLFGSDNDPVPANSAPLRPTQAPSVEATQLAESREQD